MKQRFSSLDVKVITHELSQTLPSLRLSNIYDLSSRIFLLKFHKPTQRSQLLLETGFRCHLTSFSRTAASEPSPFIKRLRKFLKSRRVTQVRQVGTDRIIEIVFSDGQPRLFLEFYAAGNIVLTDGELNVLAVFRSVSEEREGEEVKISGKYRIDGRQNLEGAPPVNESRLTAGLEEGKRREDSEQPAVTSKPKKASRKEVGTLRKVVTAAFPEFPPPLVDHVLTLKHIDSKLKANDVLADQAVKASLLEALTEAESIIKGLTSGETCTGHILAKPRKGAPSPQQDPEDDSNLVYEDFQPFLPSQYQTDSGSKVISIPGFNATVDRFFSSIESQRLVGKLIEREENAKRKLETARKDHENRIGSLKKDQELNIRKAQAIEANIERVEEAAAAVNGLIAQGMDWAEIATLVEMEQDRGNPVALMIKLPLKLYENVATILLAEYEEDDDEDFEGDLTDEDVSESEEEKPSLKSAMKKSANKTDDKRMKIDIDLALSAWSNAKIYYDQKRFAAVKEEKTTQASEKALKNHEKKVMADLKKGLKTEKDVLRPVRQQFWFEKFWFFISSEGYLVLGGKDAQQIELLHRKHFKRGDVFVHCDVTGSIPLFVKNNKDTPSAPIPPSTLSQAGTYAVSTSTAWDSKAIMSAWWVNSENVSKIAPTGDVLGPGRFHIKGEKSFLPPSQLLLGFSILFLIDEESKKKHQKHRVPPVENTQTATDEKRQEDDDHPETSDDGSSGDEDFPDVDIDSDDGRSDTNVRTATNPLQSFLSQAMKKQPDPESRSRSTAKQVQSLPTRERKALEAAPSASSSDGEEEENDESSAQPSSSHPPADSSSTPNSKSSAPTPLPRGARTKAKRAAQKYSHQDEEDKALAMQLLGSAAGEERRKLEEAARAERLRELEETRKRKAEAKQRLLDKAKAAEEKRVLAAVTTAEGVEAEEEEDVMKDVDLDALVTAPLSGDRILATIPFCAPWGALTKAKYRAKLQPGSVKKSKAAKEVLFAWGGGEGSQADTSSEGKGKPGKTVDEKGMDTEKAWLAEIEGIRGWRETEVIGAIPVGKVRATLSGVVVRAGKGGNEKGKGGQKKGGGGGGGGGKKKK